MAFLKFEEYKKMKNVATTLLLNTFHGKMTIQVDFKLKNPLQAQGFEPNTY